MEANLRTAATVLEDGTDSGKVDDGVKLQLFVNSLGICAAPDCNQRLAHHRTKLGECAHIIPRKVGSHPREDHLTSLDDRKKDANLLYLCEMHHKIVDNREHAATYTADILRKWKKDHEAWAANVTKNSPYLSQDIKDILAGIGTQVAQQVNVSETVIGTLIDSCRELLHKQLINEARVFLSQIDILLLRTSSDVLRTKVDLLDALLLIRTKQIPEAKKCLLQIIQNNPGDAEAMLEYVELCDNTPEPDDEAERIERLTRDLAGDHPRLLLIDLARKYKRHEAVELQAIPDKWSDDVRINARFTCQYALFCDFVKKTDLRDALIDRWEKELPSSPRPHLFRVLFKTSDIFRAEIKEAQPLQEILEFSKQEREKAKAKDPLTTHDQISWLMQEMRLELAYVHISGADKDSGEIRNDLVSLITQCYYDSFINDILPGLLGNLRIEPDQWKAIVYKINESKVAPSSTVIDSLFIQALPYEELRADLIGFLNTHDSSGLSKILQAIQEADVTQVGVLVNAKQDPIFALMMLQTLGHHEIALSLAELVEVTPEHQADLLYARLKVLDLNKRDEEALALIATFSIDHAASFALHTIERITYRNKHWHLFVPPALRLLEFDIPQSYRTQLHGQLAVAYFHQGDDSNAIAHAEKALDRYEELGTENSHNILHVLGQSFVMKGLADDACRKFQAYAHIKRSFPLLLEEADLYLKSSFADKHEKALSLIKQAFEEADVYEDRLYLSAFMLLVELANAGKIPLKNEASIEDGLFIKLDGFSDGWFYIGEEEKSLGAKCIKRGTANYNAVIHKAISEEIDWPADKFSRRDAKHKILHIVTPYAFLSQRAHEAMENVARIGDAPIWSIQVIKEDGSLDKDNLKQFYEEQFQHDREFFETYTTSPLPFSFLCKMQGGLASAMGRISSERKGFIRCNNSTQADIDSQKATAHEVLKGTACFIEGLAALMLAEAGLLEPVIKAVPNLGVSTAVIRLLRKIAGEFETNSSSTGRGTFVEGNFEFRPRNKEGEEAFRDRLLQSADMLDKLPNKVIGKTYPKVEGDRNLDHMLPDYFVDAFRYAQENNAHILTDDPLFVQAYKLIGESSIPQHFSSLSLVRALAEEKQITWEAHWKYFALLSGYRYHLLPVSVDDMVQAVFPPASGALVSSAPQNISFLNLQLTLSREYGVEDKTAISILSSFFSKLIQDDSIPAEIADEIFALTIVRALAKRDKKLMARVIFQICHQNMPEGNWVSQRSKTKLDILNKQLAKFAQDFDPIVIEAPLLLRVTDPLSKN